MNKPFVNTLRVRYGETDQMGYVYYGNYALYLELARTELIRNVGVSYKDLEKDGIMLPVSELNISYRSAAKYDDELTMQTHIIGDINRKITFKTIIHCDNRLVAEGNVSLFFVDANTRKVISCPEHIKQKLVEFSEA